MVGAGDGSFLGIYVKFFFLLTPFFVTSTFLAMTTGMEPGQRRRLALRVAGAAVLVAFALLFFGNTLFACLGITVDAFRVGAGGLLFLSAVELVRGRMKGEAETPDGDIAVVPLAVPVTIGPATTGALLVAGVDAGTARTMLVLSGGLLAALATVGLILFMATTLERVLGPRGLSVLSKVTGLMLAAMSAEMMVTGAANLWLRVASSAAA